MNQNNIYELMESVRLGNTSPEEAVLKLKMEPFEDLGYAKVDHHRGIRQGTPEIIYGQNKTKEQIAGIASSMISHGQETILITRIGQDVSKYLKKFFDIDYNEQGHLGIIGDLPEPDGDGKIVVATGGTSDIPVAEEAAMTAQALGNEVTRLYDVGVSGVHRLLSHTEEIMTARVIIAVAGMEGALPSVIGGLADSPVIAVPTSVGYGASFGGVAALLSMLNSCASGVSVVNIDNGFGAGYLANMINHLGKKP